MFLARSMSTKNDTQKFGDFTQKVDDAVYNAPTIEENEIKIDSKHPKDL